MEFPTWVFCVGSPQGTFSLQQFTWGGADLLLLLLLLTPRCSIQYLQNPSAAASPLAPACLLPAFSRYTYIHTYALLLSLQNSCCSVSPTSRRKSSKVESQHASRCARERERSIGTEFRWISVCSNSSSRWVVVGCSWNQPPSINTPHSSKIASLFSCRSGFFLFFWVGLFVFHLTFFNVALASSSS